MTTRAEINTIIETWGEIGRQHSAFLQALDPELPVSQLPGLLVENGLSEELKRALYSALRRYTTFHPTQPSLGHLASFAGSSPLPHKPTEPGVGPGLAAFINEGFRRTGPEETK